jgi:hypothetical protein
MKKVSTIAVKQSNNFREQRLTIGLDLGDRSSWYCVLDESGTVLLEQRLRVAAPAETRTPNLYRVDEIAHRRVRMEGWRQRLGFCWIVAGSRSGIEGDSEGFRLPPFLPARLQQIGPRRQGFATPRNPRALDRSGQSELLSAIEGRGALGKAKSKSHLTDTGILEGDYTHGSCLARSGFWRNLGPTGMLRSGR